MPGSGLKVCGGWWWWWMGGWWVVVVSKPILVISLKQADQFVQKSSQLFTYMLKNMSKNMSTKTVHKNCPQNCAQIQAQKHTQICAQIYAQILPYFRVTSTSLGNSDHMNARCLFLLNVFFCDCCCFRSPWISSMDI